MNAGLTDSLEPRKPFRLDFHAALRERLLHDAFIPHLPDYYLQLAILLAGARLFQPKS